MESGGKCGTVVTLRLPAQTNASASADDPTPVPVVVVVLDSVGGTSSPLLQAINHRLTSDAFGVAEVTLCGYGEIGPTVIGEPHPYASPNSLASFTGRTLVGIHAHGLRSAIESIKAADFVHGIRCVVAADHKDAAALHLAAMDPGLAPAYATLGGVASYGMVAGAEYYSAPSFMDVPGVLANYDLQDLVARSAQSQTRQTPAHYRNDYGQPLSLSLSLSLVLANGG